MRPVHEALAWQAGVGGGLVATQQRFKAMGMTRICSDLLGRAGLRAAAAARARAQQVLPGVCPWCW